MATEAAAAEQARASEVALITAAAAGELASVRALLDGHGPAVYGYVFARVGGNEGAAEDIVQETLIEAVRSAHTFRGDSSLRTWLIAISRRRLARHYEAERRAALAHSGLIPVDATDADPAELRDQVTRALGRLPALHRQVLVLKYLDDLAVERIAQELGRTRVQVQSLLQRARAGLRKELEADGARA